MEARRGYCSEKIKKEVYIEILDKLGEMQKTVYDAVKSLQPCSNEDVAIYLKKFPNETIPRIYELRGLGLVIYAGEGKSARSGRKVSLWKTVPVNPQLSLFGR
jgi:hypothetical protein